MSGECEETVQLRLGIERRGEFAQERSDDRDHADRAEYDSPRNVRALGTRKDRRQAASRLVLLHRSARFPLAAES
jgi:hypothetical protein